jgi:hypothetical protein
MHSMAKPLMLLSDETRDKVVHPDQELVNGLVSGYMTALKPDNLAPTNAKALDLLAQYFAGRENVVVERNLWLWTRRIMVDVTMHALYGQADPFAKDPKLEGSLW